MIADRSISRKAGDDRIVTQAQSQVQSFFDELKNGTRNYRTIASLDEQIAQEYRGRCILELLQNAHDALANVECDDLRQIAFVLSTSPEPVLLVGNSGHPFRIEDFEGICQLGQSPKDPNESVGNKGLGFRSVLGVSSCPEIWSIAPPRSAPSFVFRFDPSVSNQVATAAQTLEKQGLNVRSPFDPGIPLVDWSQEQLNQFRKRLSDTNFNSASEAKKFLSPYLFPLQIEGVLPEVEELLSAGYSTVIRLRLDGGGRVGTSKEAMQSVKDQLQKLDARSMVFLSHLEKLVIDIDDERRILERIVDSDIELSGCQRTRQQRLLVGCSGTAPEDNTIRQFQVWTRIIGGDEDPDQEECILDVVKHLPNRWPEIRQVALGIAVEEALDPEEGVFVIFLPTEMTTGTGAHINAPFYGSLNRRRIDFDDCYNKLLIESVLDLCLDAVSELISEEPEDWRAQAVIDLLSSTTVVDRSMRRLMDRLHERAAEQDRDLKNKALVLCDDGWHVPGEARMMPDIPDHNLIGAERWREHTEFAVVSTVLDGRQAAVKALLTKLDGLPSPTHCEWRRTIEQVAMNVQTSKIDVTWDDFFGSVIAVLPADLRDAGDGTLDPLANMKFLPTQDRRLLSASDRAKLFFLPVRGVDAAADLVGEVPDSVKHLVAFLHRDIRTREEGPQGRNTAVQKFLDYRFVRTFEREEILRVILEALPSLPASHGGPESELCADLFAWTIKLLGNEESETLLPLIKRLPVACHGGWFAMSDATFGPGWPNRLGDLVWSFADELPEDAATQLRRTVLLPPDDMRWRVAVGDQDKLLDRAGVFDGLRLQNVPKVCFHMSSNSYELPADPPTGTSQAAWDDWRNSVHKQVKPCYTGWHEYILSEIQLLPELHDIETLSQSGRHALSRLVLASLGSWPDGWESVTIRKLEGYRWSCQIKSPLCYWLETTAWLNDDTPVEQTLSNRWLVPPLLQSQRDRFRHLDPLSVDLAHRLEDEPKLKEVLISLGLNVYPTEQSHRTGPELLEALAAAWTADRKSTGFDVFLGQVRDAWKHLDPDKGLPKTFLVRTDRRTFSTRGPDELTDVYLPDNRDRTRSLQEHGKHILEMEPREAISKADVLAVTSIRRASKLKERFLIDGMPWTGRGNGIPSLNETGYAAWLPVTLLTVAAHGGSNPTGAMTKTWREAADRLRATHILECEEISGELIDEDQVVASNEPKAQWLPGYVLAIRRDVELSYGDLAPAAQAMLDRQDLLKDLRLVLGTLAGQKDPTSDQIGVAMERAEIDDQALADIRYQWAGNISLLVDRIRPVLELLGVLTDELDAVSTDIKCLTEWLSSNLQQWSAPDLLSAARRSQDDRAMGEAAWCALGAVAQLPAWNKALAALGDRYVTVENCRVDEQTREHLEEAMPLLRGFARYVAVDTDNPNLFNKIEAASQNFKGSNDWSTQWWEVPFEVVIDELRAGYAEIAGTEYHLEVLEGAKTVDDLHTAFQTKGIATDLDPYEIAGLNKKQLDKMLLSTHDLHRTWVEFNTPDSIAPETPEPSVELDSAAYLHQWSDAELLERALRIIDDEKFIKACDGCTNLADISQRLKLTPENIHAHHQERLRRDQEKKRRRRTFDVAGAPFEVGTASYGDLFEHLKSLADPEGPHANKDESTPLSEADPSGSGLGGGRRRAGRISHRRPPADLRELVGVVGEMHAYRFLCAKFGSDVVTRDAWVSEIRLKVLPLVEGEPDNTSDSHGFDFRFIHRRRKWHVEVKATMGDDSQFDLGISEINTATRLARAGGGRWRILRVRNALSDQPEFDWLLNPFEKGSSKLFRLHRGGMMVSYTRRET